MQRKGKSNGFIISKHNNNSEFFLRSKKRKLSTNSTTRSCLPQIKSFIYSACRKNSRIHYKLNIM